MIDDKTYNAVLCAAKDGTLVDAVPYGCAAEIDVGGETKSAPLLDVIDRLIGENERLSRTLEDVRVWAKDAGGEVRRLTAENERLRAKKP